MSKKIYLLLTTSMLIGVMIIGLKFNIAQADDDNSSTTTASTTIEDDDSGKTLQERARKQRESFFQKRSEIDTNRLQRQEEREEKKADREIKLSDFKQDRIEKFAERMFKRIEAAFTRIERLAERLTERLNKFDERGVDTTESRTLLAEANSLIDQGRASSTEAIAKIDTLLTGEINRDLFIEIKEIIKEVVAKVKVAHQKVVEAITKARAAAKELEDDNQTGTTTDES